MLSLSGHCIFPSVFPIFINVYQEDSNLIQIIKHQHLHAPPPASTPLNLSHRMTPAELSGQFGQVSRHYQEQQMEQKVC